MLTVLPKCDDEGGVGLLGAAGAGAAELVVDCA
jgi:hypothetical protein